MIEEHHGERRAPENRQAPAPAPEAVEALAEPTPVSGKLPASSDMIGFRETVQGMRVIDALLDTGVDTRSPEAAAARVNFTQKARLHQNNPNVADYLVNVMLIANDPFLRDTARDSLVGTSYPRAQRAFELESALKDIARDGGIFGSGPENPERTRETLKSLVDDGHFVDRMIEHVEKGKYGSYYVATALRETPLHEKQAVLRQKILNSLEGDQSYSNRNTISSMPYALDPKNPETETVLIKAAQAAPSDLGNFDAAVICSLGEVKSTAAKSEILKQFYTATEWNVSRATAVAASQHLDPELEAQMTHLISGSLAQSAWTLAGREGHSGLSRATRTLGLLRHPAKTLHNRRMQAALVLKEAKPELARKVFLDVTRSGNRMNAKCDSFAADDAVRALAAA